MPDSKTLSLCFWALLLVFSVSACGGRHETSVVTESSPSTALALRRDAPLQPDADFYNDSSELVGNTDRIQFVEFYATWCPTCNALKSMVHELEAAYWGEIDFIYLDREHEANAEIVAELDVRAQPIFFLIDSDGEIVRQWFGTVSEREFRMAFDSLLEIEAADGLATEAE